MAGPVGSYQQRYVTCVEREPPVPLEWDCHDPTGHLVTQVQDEINETREGYYFLYTV